MPPYTTFKKHVLVWAL